MTSFWTLVSTLPSLIVQPSQVASPSTLAPAPDQTTASLRASIRDGLAGLYTSIGMIAYGMVVLLPWLVLAGLVGVLVARLRRAQSRKKAAEAAGA